MTEPVRVDAPEEEKISHQVPRNVFADEMKVLKGRRQLLGLPSPTEEPQPEPSAKHGLVGLAISGGGIRSSTFSLGVIQALSRERPDGKPVFQHIDYLSTVSGGGYTGAMLSSLLAAPGAEQKPFPLRKVVGQEEPPALWHLRNGSNYLSPGGLLDQLRLPLQVVRGVLLTTVLVLPWIMLAVCLTNLLYVASYEHYWKNVLDSLRTGVAGLLALGVVLFAVFSRHLYHVLGWSGRNKAERAAAALFGVMLLAVVLTLLNSVTVSAIELPWKDDSLGSTLAELGGSWLSWRLLGWAGGAVLVGVLLSRQLQQVWRIVGLYVLSLIGPCVIFTSYMLLCMWHIETPYLHPHLKEALPTQSAQPRTLEPHFLEELMGKLPGVPALSCVDKAAGTPEQWRLWASASECTSPPEPCPGSSCWVIESQGERLLLLNATLWTAERDGAFMALTLILVLVTLVLLDINSTSLHGFYRDRLSKLYLFKLRERKVEPNDAFKLSELNGQDGSSSAPYHLVNATLNLQGQSSEELRGRKADFFLFSKHYCGSPHTGYCETKHLEKVDPRINLGTAMAISGAAAAPNMGSMDLSQLRFLMAMLNVRLSYWVPNPQRILKRGTSRLQWLSGPGSINLLREALGFLDLSGPYVNVSDGGHLENLGVYELLRRRCKVIIAIDGEADPKLEFHSLRTLMRYSWIDLGVRIDMSGLEQLQPGAGGLSARHVAFGTIRYGEGWDEEPDATGIFVYIKSSVTGNESPIIAGYRAANPAFPHESTADQFFNEHQFESYRALGEHIGKELLELQEFKAVLSMLHSQPESRARSADAVEPARMNQRRSAT